jgi:hypothetical protein
VHKKLFSQTSLAYIILEGWCCCCFVVIIAQNQNEEKTRRREEEGEEEKNSCETERESSVIYTERERGKGVLKRGIIHSNGAATIGRRIRPTKNERVFFV